MKTIVTKSLLILLILYSAGRVDAQLYVGNTGLVYISSGEQLYINGNMDVINGGTVTHNATSDITVTGTGTLSGVMEYTAMGNQTILPFNHETIRVNGSGNKILSANTSVNTVLEFGGTAKLVTGNYVLALTGGSSSITGTAAFGNTATSWIVTGNGSAGIGNAGIGGVKIESIGSTGRSGTILYPIGPTTSSYNPITLINTGTTDDFTVTVNDQPVPGAPETDAVHATWNIAEVIAGGSNVTLGTQWNLPDEGAGFNRSLCAVVHSDGAVVNYHASIGAASGAIPFTKTGSGFTSFSPFGVTSNSFVLPLTFLKLNAYSKNYNIEISWDVAEENGTLQYEVEKIISGEFKSIGKLSAGSVNSSTVSYNFTDQYPLTGNNFYRIKITGKDGSVKYSSVVKVKIGDAVRSVSVYPNPVTNSTPVLQLHNQPAGIYTIAVLNTMGQVITKQQIIHTGASGSYTINLPVSTSEGVYQMSILNSGNEITTIKLIIVR